MSLLLLVPKPVLKILMPVLRAFNWFGVYWFPISILYRSYINGNIGQKWLCKRLGPHQINNFVKFHEQQKEEFEKSADCGFTDVDDLPVAAQEILNNPLLQTAMAAQGKVVVNKKQSQRLRAAYSQLDRLINHGILQREVYRERGKKNVVVDSADYNNEDGSS